MPTIATNVAANSSLFYLNRNSDNQANSLAKISSGSRIVRASDDAAGSAIAAGLQSDITSLEVAAQTVAQVNALLQIADGGLQRVGEILQREKALATQFESGTLSAVEEAFVNAELVQLQAEIALIATSTTFNGTALIGGAYNETVVVGAAAADTLAIDLSGVNIAGLGEAAGGAGIIAALDADINTVGTARATVGALQSAVGFQGEVVATQIENLQAAKSAIADVDIAAEQTRFTNYQVLTEAAIAGLSQANQITQSLLSLLR
jgi:flagellin